MLQDEVSELAVEIIARYQPVATDLRYIKSCMEVAYGFSRFGGYAHDISDVTGLFGDLSACDRSAAQKAGVQAKEMIQVHIKAFSERDVSRASMSKQMDDVVDNIYLGFVKKAAHDHEGDLKCVASGDPNTAILGENCGSCNLRWTNSVLQSVRRAIREKVGHVLLL